MDGIERLGYEVRVYIRVPDLGGSLTCTLSEPFLRFPFQVTAWIGSDTKIEISRTDLGSPVVVTRAFNRVPQRARYGPQAVPQRRVLDTRGISQEARALKVAVGQGARSRSF